jgi:tetratricopeptide (TPR) repeat protein
MVAFLPFVLALTIQAGPPAAPLVADRLAEVYLLYVEGRSLAEGDNLPGAIAKYRQALEVMPQAAEIRAELAGVHAQQGDLAQAETEATRALAIEPTNRSAHRLLGLIVASRVQRAEPGAVRELVQSALGHLERSTVAPVRDPVVLLTLGELYLRAGDHEKAIHTLQQFLIDRPGYPQAVMLLVQAYREVGKPEAAQALIDGFGAPSDDSPEARVRAAEALEARGEWARAADAWSEVLVDDPRDSNARVRYAAALVNGGDLPRGRGELQALVRDDPSEPNGWHMLAEVELRAGRLEAAETAARRLATLDAADGRAPLLLARIAAARGDHRGVVTLLQARIVQPAEADLASGLFSEMAARLADAWFELGDGKRAVAALESARSRVPDDLQLAFNLGAMYDQAGNQGKAETTFRAVIAADPEHAQALNYLGYMLADRGRKLTEAVGLIQRALTIDPENPAYLDSLGWAYFKLGRLAEAVGPLERAAAGAPDSSVIQDHLGEAYLRLRRYADAAAVFDRALAGDLDGITAETLTRKRDRASQSAGKR